MSGEARATVTLNGEDVPVGEGVTLADLVRRLGHDPSRPGVAAAVDGEVVRRVRWADTPVAAGAVVEVLTAVQGGA